MGYLSGGLAVAADVDDVRVYSRTNALAKPGALVIYEDVTRGGQTNLLRITSLQDGVTNSMAHQFYHRGAYLGRYSQGGGFNFVNTAAGAPLVLSLVWDASARLRAATVTTTNREIVDSFTYTNGVFRPDAEAAVAASNRAAGNARRR